MNAGWTKQMDGENKSRNQGRCQFMDWEGPETHILLFYVFNIFFIKKSPTMN